MFDLRGFHKKYLERKGRTSVGTRDYHPAWFHLPTFSILITINPIRKFPQSAWCSFKASQSNYLCNSDRTLSWQTRSFNVDSSKARHWTRPWFRMSLPLPLKKSDPLSEGDLTPLSTGKALCIQANKHFIKNKKKHEQLSQFQSI
jgi:hypothetical protein